ncbi:MAG: hypothetical protein ACQETK_04260 [Pseudomonadota bacterium]
MPAMTRHSTLLAGLLAGAMLLAAPAAASDDLEQRLERMEAELEALREELRRRDEASDAPAETRSRASDPAAQPEPQPRAAPTPAAPDPAPRASERAGVVGEVHARYFLESDPLPSRPPSGTPMTEGLVALEEDTLVLEPGRYGGPGRGFFNRFRDASVHRAAGLHLEGYLDLPRSGEYRFDLAPKPAREGGGSPVINEMIVYLEVAGEPVLELESIESWRHLSLERDLEEGRHPFTLWVVSNSPGFGPSPTDSSLELGVRSPGRAEVTPLHRLMFLPAE